MNTSSNVSRAVQHILTAPTRGVVGLVDDLLTVCKENELQLEWEGDWCRLRSKDGDWAESMQVPIRKSVFRAVLARLAALCNEQTLDAVSPYGGRCEFLAGANPGVVLSINFVNTPAEQKLELTTRPVPADGTSHPDQRSEEAEVKPAPQQ